MSKFRRALPPLLMTGAIVVAFGVMISLTLLYSPDCRSFDRSIAAGGVVLLAGCASARRTVHRSRSCLAISPLV